MSAIPNSRSAIAAAAFQHQLEEIRHRVAPPGAVCPHCQGRGEIYYSSTQLRRPVYKRLVFAYLRCHRCTHRFRHLRLALLVFWAGAMIAGLAASIVI